MAKGARASTRKANNAKLKSKVFGPVEDARTQRLAAKLQELISQPKPAPAEKEVDMEVEEDAPEEKSSVPAADKPTEDMEVDQDTSKATTSSKPSKGRIEKRRVGRKASIVFPRYKNGRKIGKSKAKK